MDGLEVLHDGKGVKAPGVGAVFVVLLSVVGHVVLWALWWLWMCELTEVDGSGLGE